MVFGPLADDRGSALAGSGDGIDGIRREARPGRTGIIGPGSGGRSLPIDESEFRHARGGTSQVSSVRLSNTPMKLAGLGAAACRPDTRPRLDIGSHSDMAGRFAWKRRAAAERHLLSTELGTPVRDGTDENGDAALTSVVTSSAPVPTKRDVRRAASSSADRGSAFSGVPLTVSALHASTPPNSCLQLTKRPAVPAMRRAGPDLPFHVCGTGSAALQLKRLH